MSAHVDIVAAQVGERVEADLSEHDASPSLGVEPGSFSSFFRQKGQGVSGLGHSRD
jgi:hypothetical protein